MPTTPPGGHPRTPTGCPSSTRSQQRSPMAREERWQRGIDATRAYIDSHGHARIASNFVTSDGFHLGTWLTQGRAGMRDQTLSAARRTELEGLGISAELITPERRGALWATGMTALRDYVNTHGHARVPKTFVTADGLTLGQWVAHRRRDHREGRLTPERKQELDALGFAWPRDAQEAADRLWEHGMAALRAYVEKNGDPHAPTNFVTEEGFNLGAWISTRRRQHHESLMPPERSQQLDALGFRWREHPTGNPAERWELGMEALRAYIGTHGDPHVPQTFVTNDGYRLGDWVTNRRSNFRLGTLTVERKSKLDALGFRWPADRQDTLNALWQQGLSALSAYVEAHGHARVPVKVVTDDGLTLGMWVSQRRRAHAAGRLSPERKVELDALGFVWTPDSPVTREVQWQEMLAAWKAATEAYQGEPIPQTSLAPNGSNLAQWAYDQRQLHRRGVLKPKRTQALTDAGFTFSSRARQTAESDHVVQAPTRQGTKSGSPATR